MRCAEQPFPGDEAAAVLMKQALGLLLYGTTLALEIPCALARWLLVYVVAFFADAVLRIELEATSLAFVAAAAVPVWSLLGVVFPGRGWVWRRQCGGRRPTAWESEAFDLALAGLHDLDPAVRPPRGWFVLDDPRPMAAVSGSALLVTRGLVESDDLACVLAHELGHLRSLDGRLTDALNRLAVFWGLLATRERDAAPDEDSPPRRTGLLPRLTRFLLWLASGDLVQRLAAPLWAPYWRSREYAADDYAASIGQGDDLARHLTEEQLFFDMPVPFLFANPANHPPVALRIERLSRSLNA